MARNTIHDASGVAKADPRIMSVFPKEMGKAQFTIAIVRSSARSKEIALCGHRKRNGQRMEYDVERIDYIEGRTRSSSYCWLAVIRGGDSDTGATSIASQVRSEKYVFGINPSAERWCRRRVLVSDNELIRMHIIEECKGSEFERSRLEEAAPAEFRWYLSWLGQQSKGPFNEVFIGTEYIHRGWTDQSRVHTDCEKIFHKLGRWSGWCGVYTEGLGRGKRLRGGLDAGVDDFWLWCRTIISTSSDMNNVVLRVDIFRAVSRHERPLHDLIVGKLLIWKINQSKFPYVHQFGAGTNRSWDFCTCPVEWAIFKITLLRVRYMDCNKISNKHVTFISPHGNSNKIEYRGLMWQM